MNKKQKKGIGQNHHCGSSDDRIWIFTGKRDIFGLVCT